MFRLLFLFPILFYQRCISPFTPAACRFTPSCSEYARQAFTKLGVFKALYLTVKRILKCHPFYHGSVYDPVPGTSETECECPYSDGSTN